MAAKPKKLKSKEDTLYEVIRCVRPLFRYLHAAVDKELEGSGVTVPMRAIMEQLDERERQTVPELARELNLERQSVQRVVDEMLLKKLVHRIENPAHHKSFLIELTIAGQESFKKIRAREQNNLHGIALELSRSEIDACLSVISHLTDKFSNFSHLKKERKII